MPAASTLLAGETFRLATSWDEADSLRTDSLFLTSAETAIANEAPTTSPEIAAGQSWGMERHTEAGGVGAEVASGTGAALAPTNHYWAAPRGLPARYMGKGTEFIREFCGRPDDWCPPYADASPRLSYYAFQGYDHYRAIPDGSIMNNGLVQGLNAGAAVPGLEWCGLGYQLGASYGAYNFDGNPDRTIPTTIAQQQIFVTTGFFRRGSSESRWSGGIVYDWMVNNSFGTLSQSPTLGQGRSQFEYAYTARSSIGILGCWGTLRDTRIVAGNPVAYRPVTQGNLFWHYKWTRWSADTYMWGGVVQANLEGGGNAYPTKTFGGTLNLPVTERIAIYTTGQYWDARSASVAGQEVFDFSVGFQFHPQRTAVSRTVLGRQWAPYLPVANNVSFLSDTNRL